MNVNKVLTKDYENETLGEREKNEAKTKPNEAKLKKAKMNLTLYITRAYENKPRFQTNESKPNSKPIKPNFKTTNSIKFPYTILRQKRMPPVILNSYLLQKAKPATSPLHLLSQGQASQE